MDNKTIRFLVASPCCRGAKIGYSDKYHGYLMYHCLGCGKVIDKKIALSTIKSSKKLLSDTVKAMTRYDI